MGISKAQALDCFASDDLIGIGMEADAIRRNLHPDGVVSYTVDRSCSLNGEAASPLDELRDAVSEGATTICLAPLAGQQPSLATLEQALSSIREAYPALRLHALSAGQLAALAADAKLTPAEALSILKDAGLDSISGEIDGLLPAQWLDLHRLAHRAGLRSSAELVFGVGETPEQRVDQLFAVRELQDETGGFVAFAPVSHRPAASSALEEPTAVEYLRTLAIARMVLDNFTNIEASCVAQGLKVMQMALRFGANDSGAISADRKFAFTEEDLRRVIRDAGFKPVERDTLYRTMFLNN